MSAAVARLFPRSEPHSLIAFERHARVETSLLVAVAAIAAVSVVVAVGRMDLGRPGRPVEMLEAAPELVREAGWTQPAAIEAIAVRAAVDPALLALVGPESDDVGPAAPAPSNEHAASAWSEREFYEEFLASANAGELAERVTAALDAPAARAQTVAALRVLLDVEHPRAAEFFVRACSESTSCSDARGEAVPSVAIRLAGVRAPRETQARDILLAVATAESADVEARCAGVRTLVASVPQVELCRVESLLARVRQTRVADEAFAALDARRHPAALGSADEAPLE